MGRLSGGVRQDGKHGVGRTANPAYGLQVITKRVPVYIDHSFFICTQCLGKVEKRCTVADVPCACPYLGDRRR
jgi:hypothetical protein